MRWTPSATESCSIAADVPAPHVRETKPRMVSRAARVDSGRAKASTGGGRHAEQEREREEREAVRGVEGQGHVEGARGEDRELAGRVEPWREELGVLELVLV